MKRTGLWLGIFFLVIAWTYGGPSSRPGAARASAPSQAGAFATGLSPTHGTAAGGTPVAITGTGLAQVTSITVGATSVTCTAMPTAFSGVRSPGPAFAKYERAIYDASRRAPTGSGRRPLLPNFATSGGCLTSGSGELFVLMPAHAPGPALVDVLGSRLTFTYITAPPPEIDALIPNTGSAIGGRIPISFIGSGFTGATGATFGGLAAPGAVLVFSDTDAFVTAYPAGTAGTSVHVQITTPGGTSATTLADKFAYTAPPVPAVSVVTPLSGPSSGGTPVTIYGSGFLGATQVKFGVVVVTLPFANDGSDNSVGVYAPAGTSGTSVHIKVVGPGGTSADSTDLFSYLTPVAPTISRFGPTSGPTAGGDSVFISGSGFTGTSQVTFGGILATSFSVISDNRMQAISPAGSGSVHITVTSGGGPITSTGFFTYGPSPPPTPEVDGLSGPSGNADGGTFLTIYGRGLSNVLSVQFGSVQASLLCFFVCTDTYIGLLFGTPAHSPGLVDVTVTTIAGTSLPNAADQYTFVAIPPVITAVSPNSGYAQALTSVTIYGSGLIGVTAVHFGAALGTTYGTPFDEQTAAGSPPGSGTVDITATSHAGTSVTNAGDLFTYLPEPALAVTAVGPSKGLAAGGSTVYITGTGFGGASAVKFGSTPATTFRVFSDSLIQATSPPGTGPVDVRVTTLAGPSPVVAADSFIYLSAPYSPIGVGVVGGAPGTGTAIVSWSAPSWNGGSAITSYTVRCSPACTPVVVSGSTHMATISGLNGIYSFTVTATNVYGEGPPATTARIVIRGPIGQEPGHTPPTRQPVHQSGPPLAPPPR
jgi:hypothetical protein